MAAINPRNSMMESEEVEVACMYTKAVSGNIVNII